jgi:hypothetical protein
MFFCDWNENLHGTSFCFFLLVWIGFAFCYGSLNC